MALDIADAVAQYWKLATDLTAAFDFAKQGPHSLEELQVSPGNYKQFSSYGDFVKLEPAQAMLAKRFGPAGDGYQYHHIVTQGGRTQMIFRQNSCKTPTISFACRHCCTKRLMVNT
jgi:hypothetical protein